MGQRVPVLELRCSVIQLRHHCWKGALGQTEKGMSELAAHTVVTLELVVAT